MLAKTKILGRSPDLFLKKNDIAIDRQINKTNTQNSKKKNEKPKKTFLPFLKENQYTLSAKS